MSNELRDYECRQLQALETGWVREQARNAGFKDGEAFAILVHMPGRPNIRLPVPVYDLFLDPLPDHDTLVRRKSP